MFLAGALDLAGAPILPPTPTQPLHLGLDAAVMASGLVAAGLASRPVRVQFARVFPIEPGNPVHSLGLALSVVLFGLDLAVISFTDVLALAQSQPPVTLADLAYQETPFLVLAAAGVGILVRRDASKTVRRLGFVRPAWWHIVLAVAAAGVFIGLIAATDGMSHAWTPEIAHRVDAASRHLFGQLASGPVGIVALALTPAICEEALFRGALQPRIGLVATALLFTSIHSQYGLSFDTLGLLVIALGLGLVRKYLNTTASAACHFTYNLLVGINLSGPILLLAIGVEVALIGVSAYAIWSRRPRPAVSARS